MNYLNSEPVDRSKEDLFVTMTIHRLRSTLVRLFVLKVAYQYPGGIGEAVQELIEKAITE